MSTLHKIKFYILIKMTVKVSHTRPFYRDHHFDDVSFAIVYDQYDHVLITVKSYSKNIKYEASFDQRDMDKINVPTLEIFANVCATAFDHYSADIDGTISKESNMDEIGLTEFDSKADSILIGVRYELEYEYKFSLLLPFKAWLTEDNKNICMGYFKVYHKSKHIGSVTIDENNVIINLNYELEFIHHQINNNITYDEWINLEDLEEKQATIYQNKIDDYDFKLLASNSSTQMEVTYERVCKFVQCFKTSKLKKMYGILDNIQEFTKKCIDAIKYYSDTKKFVDEKDKQNGLIRFEDNDEDFTLFLNYENSYSHKAKLVLRRVPLHDCYV